MFERHTKYCGRTLASAGDPEIFLDDGSEVATSKTKKNGLHTLFWHTSWQLVAHVLTADLMARRSWKGQAISGVTLMELT